MWLQHSRRAYFIPALRVRRNYGPQIDEFVLGMNRAAGLPAINSPATTIKVLIMEALPPEKRMFVKRPPVGFHHPISRRCSRCRRLPRAVSACGNQCVHQGIKDFILGIWVETISCL